jgi:hypothetical protein
MRMISDDSLFTIVLFASAKISEREESEGEIHLVPENGYRKPAVVVRVRAQVKVLDVLRAEEGVNLRTGECVDLRERPAIVPHARRDDRHSFRRYIQSPISADDAKPTNDILQALEFPDDERPRRPR